MGCCCCGQKATQVHQCAQALSTMPLEYGGEDDQDEDHIPLADVGEDGVDLSAIMPTVLSHAPARRENGTRRWDHSDQSGRGYFFAGQKGRRALPLGDETVTGSDWRRLMHCSRSGL
eukprot:TRINITY_DN75879_c0_g1_i1.p2 TRINITY_DN75879_c0_g1~~TRINITY_DN75879_c0_g1_i1.p2  ORF type:complete len:117 (+),score=10.97 TRINITY_DN75879_c0_g1_i1:29-379(+)